MVVGVNGVGKTTTIGKLAARQTTRGKKVLIAAADTFRAAAIEQLTIWAERAQAEIVKHKDNADPSAVVFDSIEAARSRNVDIVYIDTAGRLHTKINLMEEIKKIKRTIAKKNTPGPPMKFSWFWMPPPAKMPFPKQPCSMKPWTSPVLPSPSWMAQPRAELP